MTVFQPQIYHNGRGEYMHQRAILADGFMSRGGVRYEDSASRRFLSHRALAALRAISFLLSGESFSALAFPPFLPPSLPSSTAAGFFYWS